MKNVNEALKNEIKAQVETIRGIREKINGLKWKSGDTATYRRLQKGEESCSSCMTAGCRTRTTDEVREDRKARKALHRPETGPERATLWDDKRAKGTKARYLMLAYGVLRGRTYCQIESKCREGNEPRAYWIASTLETYGVTISESAIEAWLKGSVLDTTAGGVPRKSEKVPAVEEASL